MALNRYDYRLRFGNRCACFAVIHARSTPQVIEQSEIALGSGLDGVFLVNHAVAGSGLDAAGLVAAAFATRRALGDDAHIGVNFLDLYAAEAFDLVADIDLPVDALWSDDAEIDERADVQYDALEIDRARRRLARPVDYHGGVAFKYQRPVTDLAGAVTTAVDHVDVLCTSGPGTGQATSVTKLTEMRAAAGDAAISIASGVTPDNASRYVDLVDAILVATGISRTFHELDPVRCAALACAVGAR